MIRRFRRAYGASPLHLLALLASLSIAGAAAVRWLDNTAPIAERILIWFLGAVIGHDLILVPLYSLLDRISFGAVSRRPGGDERELRAGWTYVRVPLLLSGLLLLVFFPEIFRLGDATFHSASGLYQDGYLIRYLLSTGAVFALSGLAYAASRARGRVRERGQDLDRDPRAFSADKEGR